MNAEFCKLALERVGNPNILVNIVSRRVKQLNAGGGAGSRPLVMDTANLGATDIALREIIEGKLGWQSLEEQQLIETQAKKRRKALT